MTTQEDLEALDALFKDWQRGDEIDFEALVQALTAHRIAAEQRIVAWLREDAGKTADELRRLHRGQKLTPAMTLEWETLIRLKAGIAQAIETGEHRGE